MLVEGREASDEALRYSRAVARRLGGELDLLLLLPLDLDPRRDGAALQRQGRRLAEAWCRRGVPGDPPVRIHVRAGDPWSEFCKFAALAGSGFQLVVWATGGGRADGRVGWPSGHWASRIQAELSCPVVLAQHRTGSAEDAGDGADGERQAGTPAGGGGEG